MVEVFAKVARLGSLVKIAVARGDDLYVDVAVPVADAALGGEVAVPTLKGRSLALRIPDGTQGGRRFRLAGQGMPKLGSPETRGDMFVVIRPQVPKNLTEEERELFRRLKELRSQKG